MTDRDAILQLYVWMGNSGMGKDHPWVLFVEKHLRETEATERAATAQLRDEFAAKALAGYLATYGDSPHPAEKGARSTYAETLAAQSYAMADAMLAARGR